MFFHDSGFQICLRIQDSDDYFAYYEYGIFWIYSNDECFRKSLEQSGLSETNEHLISDPFHWNFRLKDKRQCLVRFIGISMSSSKFCEREDTEHPGTCESLSWTKGHNF